MESKHDRTRRYTKQTDIELLIEPVWNRNVPLLKAKSVSLRTFNRTSMESKPNQIANILGRSHF